MMTSSHAAGRVKRVILVVEDTEDMRDAFRDAFERAGHHVESADSVRGALVILRGIHFDVVLTDYALGDGTGLEVLHRAAAEGLLDGTSAIVCTAYRHVAAPPGVLLLYKPVNLDDLLRAVEGPPNRAPLH